MRVIEAKVGGEAADILHDKAQAEREGGFSFSSAELGGGDGLVGEIETEVEGGGFAVEDEAGCAVSCGRAEGIQLGESFGGIERGLALEDFGFKTTGPEGNAGRHGLLEVGVSGDSDVDLLSSDCAQGVGRLVCTFADGFDGVAVVEAEGGENLVVAGSSEVDFAAKIAEFLGESVFDGGVAVLFFEGELDVFVSEFIEGSGEFFDFFWGEVVLLA